MSKTNIVRHLIPLILAGLIVSGVFTSSRFFMPPPVAGYTEVETSVGENGEARVRIPIAVPKGTILAPELALTYNSQAGNGLLGHGFQLEGLYSISRTGANKAQDGVIDGVDFDASDRFALNGERLVLVKGAVYGQNGAEYATEQTNFSQVVSYGGSNISPQHFKVWTKSGLILEFGNTTDSRIEASVPNNAHPLVWLVNKISDTKGNYMTFSYIENSVNGEFRIDKIQYTGNTSTGQTPYNSVQFSYENRPDTTDGYLVGSKSKISKRLFKIESIDAQNGGSGTVYRSYTIDYEEVGYRKTSHISQITEMGGGVAFPPTTFEWANDNLFATQELPFTNTNVYSGFYVTGNSFPARIRPGDVTGDGKMDIVLGPTISNNEGSWYVMTSTGTSFIPATWAGNTGASNYPTDQRGIKLLDVNSDGKMDIVWTLNPQTQPWKVMKSTGTGFSAAETWYTTNGFDNEVSVDRIWPMDANGDGRTDLVLGPNPAGKWFVYKNTGSSFVREEWATGAYGNADGEWNYKVDRIHPMDVDADGLTDFMFGPSDNGDWFVLKNTGSSFVRVANPWATNVYGSWHNKLRRIYSTDFNGDGLTDFVFGPEQTTGKWYALLNKGNALQDLGVVGTGFYANYYNQEDYIRVMDLNGDGMNDFLFGPETNGTWRALYTNGKNLELGYYDGLWLTDIYGNWNGDPAKYFVRPMDVNGDGGVDLVYGPGTDGIWHVITNRPSDTPPHLLHTVTNGNGVVTEFLYDQLTDPGTYQKGTTAVFPKMDFIAPLFVVREIRSDNGIGGANSIFYKYFDAKLDLEGRGFRGFGKTEQIDSLRNMKTVVFYERNHQFISSKVVATEQRHVDNNALIYSLSNTLDTIEYNGLTVHFSFVSGTSENWYELGQTTPYKSKISTINYDNWGNPTYLTESYNSGQYSIVTTNTYNNDTTSGKWMLGRLTQATVAKTLAGKPTITKTSSFEYDAASGLLTKEVLNPGHPTKRLTTDYTLDSYGNRRTQKVSGPGITARTDSFFYDSKGRNVIKSKNALGHTVDFTYELGLLKTTIDPNGLEETIFRDGYGRPVTIYHPDGTQTNNAYYRCDGTSGCPAGAYWYTESQKTGGEKTRTYYDLLDREVRSETYALNGEIFKADTEYDVYGRVSRKSDPYSSTAYWHVLVYDARHRVISETAPGGLVNTAQYNGLTTITTNPQGQIATKVVNCMDWLVQSKDHNNVTVNYAYDSDGNMISVTDPAGNITSMQYDIRGNKISMDDPDLGITEYAYNTLGLLTQQTYANGDIISITYDLLNRVTVQDEPERTLSWEYDTKPMGIGKPSLEKIDNIVSKEYNYDTYGRPINTLQTIEGTTYTSSYTYDTQGRLKTLTYPQTAAGSTPLKLQYNYDPYGHLINIKKSGTAYTYWQADSLNNRGQLSRFTLGNGLITRKGYNVETGYLESIKTGNAGNAVYTQNLTFQWSPNHNLTQRADLNRNLQEDFLYDNLNRLTAAQVVGQSAVTVQYNAIGNITFKSNVGSYTYGQNGAGPHMVTSIDHTGVPNCFYGFQGQVVYTSYNYPRQITDGQDTSTFTYDAGRMKSTQRLVKAGAEVWKKHYVGGMFERVTEGGQIKYIHHISAMGETVAILQRTGVSTDTLRYIHHDHLGSLHTITRYDGILFEAYSFDAWGKPRSAVTWQPYLVATPTPPYQRGFTFHEMVGIEDLIHMNARLYDPAIGRVLSADPFVQLPDNLQSLNRASYVFNNPLSFTDPTGFFSLGDIFKAVTTFIVGLATAGIAIPLLGPALAGIGLSATTAGVIASGIGFGFGSSFSGTLLNGGDLGDAVRNGVTGAISAGLSVGLASFVGGMFGAISAPVNEFTRAIAHGVAQGATSDIFGGSFRSGFSSGFGSSLFGSYSNSNISSKTGRVIAAAVVGGTFSKIGGGNFINGAVTGAFIHLFNHESHKGIDIKCPENNECYAQVGQRELGGWLSFVPSLRKNWLLKGMFQDAVHEQIFFFGKDRISGDVKVLESIGFNGSVYLGGEDIQNYWLLPEVYDFNAMQLSVNRVYMYYPWMPGNTCQDFVSKAQFNYTFIK